MKDDGMIGEKKGFSFKDSLDKNSKMAIIIVIAIILIAVVVAVVSVMKKQSTESNKERVSSNEVIKEKLDIDIKDPEDANDVVYDIEKGSIAKLTYTKEVSDGRIMNFIMRSSYSLEEDLTDLGYEVIYSTQPIKMTVICDDASEIEVESYVALGEQNEMKYMRAVWFDNDKYYSMVTDNLATREDFLQEVNRVIIANHISF